MDIFLIVILIIVVISALSALVFYVLDKRNTKKRKRDEQRDLYKFDKKPLSFIDEISIDIAGQKAESIVSQRLKELVDTYNCYLYENLCLEDTNGCSVEIDHMILTKGGLFVIETKGNIGVIYGDVNEKVWTSIKSRGRVKKLKNPVIQSCSHAKFIKLLLKDFYPKIIPMAVFTNADLTNITSCTVYDVNQAIAKITLACNSKKYDEKILKDFDGKIRSAIEKHSITKEKHLQNIKDRFG